jgi:hypothetical protein
MGMEAYIDLSYIFHLLLCISSIKFSKIIANVSLTKRKLFILEITSILIYLNVLIFREISTYLNILYYFIIFFAFYKNKFLTPLLTFIFSYYSQIAIIRIFTSELYLYKSILMIYKPTGFFYILICPLLLLIVEIVTRSIKSLVLLKKYRYNVKLIIQNKVYSTNAYFDSGNTLKFKDLPVVFLTEELKDKSISYEKLLVEGIGKESSEYLKGKIYFEEKEKEVYFAYVKKKSFNGCKCLLNVYLLG